MEDHGESDGSQYNTPIKGRQLRYFPSPEASLADLKNMDTAAEDKRRACNCKNSKCLKLYCECFSSGNYCDAQNCNCLSCGNNPENERTRKAAIDATLERDPHAFRPKISSPMRVVGDKQFFRGCNCKKSVCLKKYCECFQSGYYCTTVCKCLECKNYEGSREMLTARDASPMKSPTASNYRTPYQQQPASMFFNTGFKPHIPYTLPNGQVVLPPDLCGHIKNSTFEKFCDDVLFSLFSSPFCTVRKTDLGDISEEHERIVLTHLTSLLSDIHKDLLKGQSAAPPAAVPRK